MKIKKTEQALVHSLHIRTAIAGLSSKFNRLLPVRHINRQLTIGEAKYQLRHKDSYDMSYRVFERTKKRFNKEFDNKEIATDTFMTELYMRLQNVFQDKKTYDLKEKSFGVLFSIFGHDDGWESRTFILVDRLVHVIEEEFAKEDWLNKVKKMTRKSNDEYFKRKTTMAD